MSQPIQRQVSSPLAASKSRLDITVAIKNKKGQWIRQELDIEERQSLVSAVETLRRSSLQQQFKEGDVFRISKDGLFKQINDKKWTNLLNDKTVTGNLRQGMRKVVNTTIDSVADFFKPTGLIEGSENILIEVRVATTQEQLSTLVTQQENFDKKIAIAEDKLEKKIAIASLKEKNIDVDALKSDQSKLKTSSQKILTILNEANLLFKEGKTVEAAKKMAQEAPAAYEQFCEDLAAWEKWQGVLIESYKVENPFIAPLLVDLKQPMLLEEGIKGFFFHIGPAIKDSGTKQVIRSSIERITRSNIIEITHLIQQSTAELYDQEQKYNESISKAINYFKSGENQPSLMQHGWTKEQIDYHIGLLEALKQHSNQLLQTLESVKEKLDQGQFKEGLKLLKEALDEGYPNYINALKSLIHPQKVTRVRLLGMPPPPPPLLIDLMHPHFIEHYASEILQGIEKIGGTTLIETAPLTELMEVMRAHSTTLKTASEGITFAKWILGEQTTNVTFARNVALFLEHYEGKRDLFDQIMKKHGISERESAFIFNHYRQAFTCIAEWNRRFQIVTELIQLGRIEEATRLYSQMMIHDYPIYAQSLNNMNYATKKWTPQVENAFQAFAKQAGFNAAQIKVSLSFQGKIIQENDKYKAFVEFAEATPGFTDFKLTEMIAAAKSGAVTTGKGLDGQLHEFGKHFEENNHFVKFFAALREDAVIKKKWMEVLREHKMSFQSIEGFTALVNDMGRLIQPIKELQQAIAMESNPLKKRALKAQLRTLAQQQQLKITQLNKEFIRLGSIKTLQAIREAAIHFAALKLDVSHPKEKMKEIFDKTQDQFILGNCESAEDFITNFESIITKQPYNQRDILRNRYSRELGYIAEIKFGDRIVQEAQAFMDLVKERSDFLQNFYGQLGIYSTLKANYIKRTLLDSPHYKDSELKKLLIDQGWSTAKIEKLNAWYDQYRREAEPLLKAKAALDEDPENIELQRACRKIAERQVPKLNRLTATFNIDFGGVQALDKIKVGILRYYQQKNEVFHGTSTDAVEYPKLREEVLSIANLGRFNIGKEISDLNNLIKEIDVKVSAPLSWDRGFLDQLINKNSPLGLVNPNREGALWSKLLKEANLKPQDLKEIIKLHQSYQTHLEKMVQLERKLEGSLPSQTSNIEAELVREMKIKRVKLRELESQFEELSGKIEKLQIALNKLREPLQTTLTHLKEAEMGQTALARLTEMGMSREETGEIYAKMSSLELERGTGGMTEVEIAELIKLIDDLNISQAFEKKRRFVRDTYSRAAQLGYL